MKFKPRDNLWFIFYTEKSNHYWVMPSRDVARLSHKNKSGANAGKYSLHLPKLETANKAMRFSGYRDNDGFDLMRAAVKKDRSKRVRRSPIGE